MNATRLVNLTSNPRVYTLARKKKLANKGEIKCDRCPPHRGENRSRTPKRNWKSRTKKGRQHE